MKHEMKKEHHHGGHHKTDGKHNESKTGKLKIHGGFKAMEHEKVSPRKK